jgi:hypothetical protein
VREGSADRSHGLGPIPVAPALSWLNYFAGDTHFPPCHRELKGHYNCDTDQVAVTGKPGRAANAEESELCPLKETLGRALAVVSRRTGRPSWCLEA